MGGEGQQLECCNPVASLVTTNQQDILQTSGLAPKLCRVWSIPNVCRCAEQYAYHVDSIQYYEIET